MAPTTTRTVRIVSEVSGVEGIKKLVSELQKLNTQTAKLGKSAQDMGRYFSVMRGTFLGWASAATLLNFARHIDELTMLTSRIQIFSKAGEVASDVLVDLGEAAIRTRSDLSGTATAYTRMALALKDTEFNSKGLLGITIALQNTFRLAGSTMAESTATMIQLAQSLGAGTLSGEELRAVMEQNTYLFSLIKKKLQETYPHLMAMGEGVKDLAKKGLITAKVVIGALVDNFEDMDKKVQGMTQTFEQTWSKGMVYFYMGLKNISDSMGLQSAFAKAMDWAIQNTWAFKVALGAVAGLAIPLLIGAIYAVTAALVGSGWGMIIMGVGAAVGALTALFIHLGQNIDHTSLMLEKWYLQSRQWLSVIGGLAHKLFLPDVSYDNSSKILEYKTRIAEVDKKIAKEEHTAAIEKKASMESYFTEMVKGYNSLKDVQKKVKSEKGLGPYFEENNKYLKLGASYFDEYMQRVEEKGIPAIKKLDEQFRKGKISLTQYNEAYTKLVEGLDGIQWSTVAAGASDYLRQTGTMAQNIAGLISGTFNKLEDEMFTFIKTGKLEFRKFTQSILDDLLKIIIRASIVQPLAKSVLSFAGSAGAASTGTPQATSYSSYAGNTAAAANGAVFAGSVAKFGIGGIFDQPTMFQYGGGNLGIMGEKGPEAIMPLKRNNKGSLGVEVVGGSGTSNPVVVNVINNSSDSETSTQERTGGDGTKVIDVLITNKTKEAFSSGKMDSLMGSLYGVRRKGA